MVLVTFRNSYDHLTSMFNDKFRTISQAKSAIEQDALFFLDSHKCGRMKKKAHWVHPKIEDYYEAVGKDGSSCIYQYFQI